MFVPKEGWLAHVFTSYIQSMSSPRSAQPGHDGGNADESQARHFHGYSEAGHSLAIAALAWALAASPSLAIDVSSARGALSLVNRSVTQDQGAWVVDYRLRYTGKTGVIITPEEIAVKVEGWVSNSRVASHALPRWSSLVVSHGPDLSAVSEVIAAADEAHRCRERLVVSVWTEDQGPIQDWSRYSKSVPRPKPASHRPLV